VRREAAYGKARRPSLPDAEHAWHRGQSVQAAKSSGISELFHIAMRHACLRIGASPLTKASRRCLESPFSRLGAPP